MASAAIFRTIAGLTVSVSLLASARAAPAQELRPLFADVAVHQPAHNLLSPDGQPRRYSTLRLATGGVAGGAVGLLIGAVIGAAVISDQDENANEDLWVDAVWGAAVGGAAGESIGLATGVYLANGRQGNLLLSMVAATAIGGIGFALLSENQDAPFGPILLVVTPIAQLASTIGIERRTSR